MTGWHMPDVYCAPERTVIVVDNSLPMGKSANAAAVIAFTLGQRHPQLVGANFYDRQGGAHPGVIFTGISILGASQDELAIIRARASAAPELDVVDFPVEGQTTVDYAAFLRQVVEAQEELRYLAVGMAGSRKAINKITGGLKLLR